MKTRHKIMSFLLSGAMVFSLLPASAIGTVKAASVNYALTATATASGSETSAFGPEKAKDGDATTKTSRWASEERDASESNPHWLAMDLCEVKTVNRLSSPGRDEIQPIMQSKLPKTEAHGKR